MIITNLHITILLEIFVLEVYLYGFILLSVQFTIRTSLYIYLLKMK